MIEPLNERSIPISPQLALRVAVVGVGAFVLFAIIFFRLWYLQVLSGSDYLRQAQVNKVRTERVAAPRGEITDRNGAVLVNNRVATVITISPNALPDVEKTLAAEWGQRATQRDNRPKGHQGAPVAIPPIPSPGLRKRFASLGRVLNLRSSTIQERVITSLVVAPFAPAKIKTDVTDSQRDYLLERLDRYPGIKPVRTYLRRYPFKDLAAQMFGTIGQISPDELQRKKFKKVPQGTIIGQSGLEGEYDSVLRGEDGLQRFYVNAAGEPRGTGRTRQPIAGQNLKLTIDKGLQQAGQKALSTIAQGKPAAFVAMDPRNGAVLAMGSLPTFDANIFSSPISKQKYEQVFGTQAGSPQFNRAITAGYPTGSTFKPITAFAALSKGVINTSTVLDSPGCITIGRAGQQVCNAGHQDLGSGNLTDALRVSADVFFYKLAEKLYSMPGQPLQKWARRLGLGHSTGIDLPGENGGTVPDSAFVRGLVRSELACRKREHKANCYKATIPNRGFQLGDEVNVATGQGDLQATPLQMAVMYSAIENGGKIVRPHLGLETTSQDGTSPQAIEHTSSRKVDLPADGLAAIRDGLHQATSADGGTSAGVFGGGNWPQDKYPVYGKTGTAQRPPHPDQSWFCAYVPDPKRPIVVATTIENAGFGADYAAPATKQILAHWFHVGLNGPQSVARSTTF